MNPGPGQPPILARIDRRVLACNRLLLMLALSAMSIVVFASVTIRYLSDYSIPWAEEVARYLMVWLTFLGVGPVLRYGGHVAIDNLQAGLAKPVARALRAFVIVAIAIFFLTLIWAGWQYVQRTLEQNTAVTEVSFAFVSAAVPVGFALALWHLFVFGGTYVAHGRFEVSADLNPDEVGAV